jgi:hypothetical protein
MGNLKPRGFIFYRGFSPIDGAPIVGIATLKSKNEKTGNMVQTYILRADMHPMDAIKSAADASICGDCVHRGDASRKRTCYVDVSKSVSMVYSAFKRGSYADYSHDPSLGARYLRGRMVRLGAYGDPAMIDVDAWLAILQFCKGWTGYSHQWRQAWAQPMLNLCMASADNASERDLARSMGWRTFRVIPVMQAPKLDREIACPASPEGGNRRQCIDCGACDGALKPESVSIAIVAHGKAAAYV